MGVVLHAQLVGHREQQGVGGDNSNSSFGTFYEGAIVAGYPTNDVELAIMNNVKAVGYSK